MEVVLTAKGEPPEMEISTIGLDIAKSVFQVHGIDGSGAVEAAPASEVFREAGPLCLVGMEACGAPSSSGRTVSSTNR
jgi:transposase